MTKYWIVKLRKVDGLYSIMLTMEEVVK